MDLSKSFIPVPPQPPQDSSSPPVPSFLRHSRKLFKPHSPPHAKPDVQRPTRGYRPTSVGQRRTLPASLSYGVNLLSKGDLQSAVQWLQQFAAEAKGDALASVYVCTLLAKAHFDLGQVGAVEWARAAVAAAESQELKLLTLLNAGFVCESAGDSQRASTLQQELLSVCSSLLGLKRPAETRVREKVKSLADEVVSAVRPNATVFSRFRLVSVSDYFPEVRLWTHEGLLPPNTTAVKVTKAVATADEKMETHKAQILGAIGVFDPMDL